MRSTLLLCLLSACSADTFVTSDAGDGGSTDGSTDAPASEGGKQDGGPANPDADVRTFQCADQDCKKPDVCCAVQGWASPSCEGSGVEGNAACAQFLECNDSRDCAALEVCCATRDPDTNTILTAKCASAGTCAGTRLCGSAHDGDLPADCTGTGLSCKPVNPSWLLACE